MLILQILFLFCSINFVYSGATAKEEQVTIPVAIQKLTGSESMTSAEGMEEFFKEANATLAKFDEDSDGQLNLQEFSNLCKALFKNGSSGESYKMDNDTVDMLFKIFDLNSDGFVCKMEFPKCYSEWIHKIIAPVSVFVIVDVQHDFIDGSMPLKNAAGENHGQEVVDPTNKILDEVTFKRVIYSIDWHPPNHISFIDNINLRKLHSSSKFQDPKQVKAYDTVVFEGEDGRPVEQRLWPRHCVQNSSGAELHPKLKILPDAKRVYKGTNPDVDSYSAFLDNDKKSLTDLKRLVDEVGASDVYVNGLAYDVCVAATAVDSLDLGYRTILIADASRGVSEDGVQTANDKIKEKNGVIVDAAQVKNMVMGVDRHPELGVFLAKQFQKKVSKQ